MSLLSGRRLCMGLEAFLVFFELAQRLSQRERDPAKADAYPLVERSISVVDVAGTPVKRNQILVPVYKDHRGKHLTLWAISNEGPL